MGGQRLDLGWRGVVERRLDKSREAVFDGKEEEESGAVGPSEKRPKRGRREDWLFTLTAWKKEDQEELRVKRECKRCEEGGRERSKR